VITQKGAVVSSAMNFASTTTLHELYNTRMAKTRRAMVALGVETLLITDPINILYATGASNMTPFSTRTPSRYLLLMAEGPAVLFDFLGCEHLSAGLPTVDVVRAAKGLCHVSSNGALVETSALMAQEIADTVRQQCVQIGELAIDRFRFETADALRAAGFRLRDADPVFSQARAIKAPLEVAFLTEAMRRVDRAVEEFESQLLPGVTEAQAWSRFQQPFIADNGQYVVSRLMQSGERTYPYFLECGDRVLEQGDLVCLDTDATAFEGYSVDFSRTFVVGGAKPSAEQTRLYSLAMEQLLHNSALIGPGASFEEVARHAWPVPAEHQASRYYCIGHGLGMSGEFPNLPHAVPGEPFPLSGQFEAGMVFCVESYVGSATSQQGVKLENQLLITETGVEVMSRYPFLPF
jgi:Xaa-Pro dipeptidase